MLSPQAKHLGVDEHAFRYAEMLHVVQHDTGAPASQTEAKGSM
jgi:hypothetical protein